MLDKTKDISGITKPTKKINVKILLPINNSEKFQIYILVKIILKNRLMFFILLSMEINRKVTLPQIRQLKLKT